MKTIARVLFSLLMLLHCACSDSKHEAFINPPHGTISIAHLKTLCKGESYRIKEDIAIEGYVVANDLYNEYIHSIVLCDESGGIEIAVECDNTASTFPISARVVVNCSSLALGDVGGKVVLGAPPTGEYTTNRISESDFARYFIIDKNKPFEIEPETISIESINASLIGNYIALNDISFGSDSTRKWCDQEPETGNYLTTERTLQDRAGNRLKVRTISQCDYRGEQIPSGWGSVWGILEIFNEEYSLRIVNHRIEFQ